MLGPLLFIVYINDIVKNIKSNVLIYADDLKIYKDVSTIEDCILLQNDLNRFHEFSLSNLLPVNYKKCHIMTITNKCTQIQFDYKLNNMSLARVDTFKDLGVIFDCKLSFANHVEHICNSAFRSLGFIIRCGRDFTQVDSLRLLYFAYVRSKLEYACIVWAPFTQNRINHLENIQRRFLKYTAFKEDGVYPVRGIPHSVLLERFKVEALSTRRCIASLKFLRNVINFHVDCTDLLGKIFILVPRMSSRSNQCFYLPTPRLNIEKHSPVYEMCHQYNLDPYVFDIFR